VTGATLVLTVATAILVCVTGYYARQSKRTVDDMRAARTQPIAPSSLKAGLSPAG
jgi:hypothetical protein